MYATKYDAENKLWRGIDSPPLFNPKISLGQVLQRFMKVHGSKVAQICDDTGETTDYNQLWSKTVRAAQNLQKLGYSKTDVFAYSGFDRNLAPLISAAFCLGCPVNTLSHAFGKADMIHMLKITKPKLMFCDVKRYGFVSECFKEVGNDAKIFTFGSKAVDSDSCSAEALFTETGSEANFIPVPIDGANDIAAILCSSGTSGLTKGVALSHASIVEKCSDIGLLNNGDIHYCPGSSYWISGLFMFILGTINGATAVVTTKTFSADMQLRLIEKHKISFLMNSPQHLVMMLKSKAIKTVDLSSIKCYWVGGNRIPAGAPAEINKYLPNGKMYTGYGLTEIALLLTGTFTEFVESDTAGKLVNGCVVKIVDDNGVRCGVGVDGEICVKSNHLLLGYYGNEKATAEAIDNEGFLWTEDVGRFDEDGYLYIRDRSKEIFKYFGYKVYPSDIESHLIQSPDIESVCVVGIPDCSAGALPAVAVIRKENSTITEQDVYEMVANHLDNYKHLRGGVYFMNAFPVTLGGKILRREVRETIIRLSKCKTHGLTNFSH